MSNMLKAIVALLSSRKVMVLLEKIDEWGLCYYEDHTLVIRESLSKDNQVRTLIHECTHYLYPELSEKSVLSIERDLYKILDVDTRKFLLIFLEE